MAIIALLIVGINASSRCPAVCRRELSAAHPRPGDRLDRGLTKAGGLAAQALSIAALVPPLGVVAALILAPVLLGLALAVAFCPETRGVDLRKVDRPLRDGYA